MKLDEFKGLMAAGRFQEALEASEMIGVKDRYFFYERAKAQLALRNYRAAVSEIDSVLESKSDWLGAHSIKISALLALGVEDELVAAVLVMINQAVAVSDRYGVFRSLFNEILDSKLEKKINLLSCCLEYYRYICGQDCLYLFFSGVVDSNLGYDESASKMFGLLADRDMADLGRHATGALSFRYGNDLVKITSGLSAYKQKITVLKERADVSFGSESVIFAACDSKYFEMFADVFISSFAFHLNNKICHIHVVDPTDAVIDKANRISKCLNNFNFSFERSGFVAPIYFAASRFIVLEQIVDLYKLDVLVCDIDAAFIDDFSVGEILSGECNIVIKADNRCSLHTYPWRGLAAGFFAVKNDRLSIEFIRSLKSFIMSFILDSPHENIWYFDQTAIYCLLKHFSECSEDFSSAFIYGETSRMIVYPDAKKETKEEFALSHGRQAAWLAND